MDPEHSTVKRKPKNWCGTKVSPNINEADQIPIARNMPAFPEGQRYYPCITQDGCMPAFGAPPDTSSGDSDHDDSIMVGMKELVPRWVASTASPTSLLYYVVKDGFSDDDFRCTLVANTKRRYTADSFQQAANQWNNLSLSLAISATTDQAKANFFVKYYLPAKEEGFLVSAFFPNDVDDVRVYNKTLVEPGWRDVLMNTFLHEIGHIIGLRHEFANDPNPKKKNKPFETRAQRFGSVNPHSVMSYDDVNNINDLDKKDVVAFYKLANGSLVNGVAIRDYTPKLLKQN